jgi:hypothetical protein
VQAAGEAGAEVVDRHAKTHVADLADDPFGAGRLDKGVLGHLHHDVLRRDARRRHQPAQPIDQHVRAQIGRGQVDAYASTRISAEVAWPLDGVGQVAREHTVTLALGHANPHYPPTLLTPVIRCH